MNPRLSTDSKFIFDFSFDSSPHLTYRLSMNKKDGFTRIFTNESIITAVADSVATALPVDVNVPYVNIDAAIRFIRSRFVDVDWDTFPDRVTIFGNDSSIPVSPDGDGDEGHFVLNLIRPASLTANPFNE
jgi:hypothetical protein